MLRCLQGLLFIGIGLFGLKWEFHGSRDKPAYIAPTGDEFYTAKAFFLTLPPWHVREKLIEAAILTGIGLYLWLTGELARLRLILSVVR
jgi:hypothetical protein